MDLPDDEMLNIEVSLKKEDYGELGSLDYCKNRAMVTALLSEKLEWPDTRFWLKPKRETNRSTLMCRL